MCVTVHSACFPIRLYACWLTHPRGSPCPPQSACLSACSLNLPPALSLFISVTIPKPSTALLPHISDGPSVGPGVDPSTQTGGISLSSWHLSPVSHFGQADLHLVFVWGTSVLYMVLPVPRQFSLIHSSYLTSSWTEACDHRLFN